MTTDKSKIKELGEKLHRFGDTYAHTKLSSIDPSALNNLGLDDIKDPNAKEVSKVIEAWKNQAGKLIDNDIEPWVKYINLCVKTYGNSFFYNTVLQQRLIANEKMRPLTYPQLLKYLYEKNITPESKFKMYGTKDFLFMTTEHAFTDGLWPDRIFLRPEWYLTYVQNLSILLKMKFNLSGNLDLNTFKQMTNFVVENKKSMKGVIDYEISRFNKEKYVEIPIFQTSVMHPAAAAIFINYDFDAEAKIAVDLATLYAKKYYEKEVKKSLKKVKSYFIEFK